MKKGFTLIEMIAAVVLISIISIVIVLGIRSVDEKEKEKKWLDVTGRVISAADVYLEKNPNIKQDIYNTGIIKYLTISEIAELGLLDENELVDPRTDKQLLKEDDLNEVKVYLNDENALEIEYPSIKSKYILFDSKTIYAFVNQEINCLKGITVYNEENQETNVDLIENIREKTNKYQVKNSKITFDEIGSYELIYTIGERNYIRTVKVLKVADKIYDTVGEYNHVIEATGTYRITVSGAQGESGGKGGTVTGKIYLTKGTILNLVVGGQEAKYGGGAGYKNGGDSSRVVMNLKTLLIGAGGGGGIGGGVGGSGNGIGGSDQGSGAGTNGNNGSGGGASYNHQYQCECKTCGGDCKQWKTEKYDCQTCGGGCKQWQNKICGCLQCCERMCNPKYSWCSTTRPWSCHTCKCYKCGTTCVSHYSTYSCNCKERSVCTSGTPTYSCNCKTCTKQSLAGKGGSSVIGNEFIDTEKISGDTSGNGKIIIEFVK